MHNYLIIIWIWLIASGIILKHGAKATRIWYIKTTVLQWDYYNRGHLDKENKTILQNGNEEFQLQLFELIRFQFNTTFQRGIKLNFSIPLYNMWLVFIA